MSQNDKMNFIIIISDTLRRDFLGCYGNEKIDTRHIDEFAKKSLIFDRAYSASFPTVPCRRDIFTGSYTATYVPWSPLNEYEPVIQKLLGPEYTKMMIVDEYHILENGYNYDRGFDGFEWIRGQELDHWKTSPKETKLVCDPNKLRNADTFKKTYMRQYAQWRHESDTFPARTGTATCNWLEDNYKNGPFYLYVDFFDPHEPWDPPQYLADKYDPGYEGEVVTYPRYDKWREFLSESELKHCRALYSGEVTLIDRWVGRIFEKIEDLGLLDNTMIFFTTDHGFLLGEHEFIGKSYIRQASNKSETIAYLPLFEEINHIPLIVYHPNGIKGRTDAIVQPPDIMSTIMSGANISDVGAQGKSFMDVVLGKSNSLREFALSFPYLKSTGVPITFVKDQYAAIFYSKKNKSTGKNEVIDKAVDGIEKISEEWEEARDLLYNIAEDPHQQNDLSKSNPEILKKYRSIMLDFLKEIDTDDEIIDRFKGE